MSNRDKIKKTCLDLFIDKGYEGVSIKMILNESGVSNGGLFHHFSSKDEIIKEMYYEIKEEMLENIKIKVDITLPTRSFIHSYWRESILWGLNHPKKKLFIEMFANSAIIRNCIDDNALKKYAFITDRIQLGLDNQEIVSSNINYFLYHLFGNTDAITNYLKKYPEDNTDEFLAIQFKQYWRSIVNF